MSRCEGPIKPYHRSFGTIIDGMIADGFLPGVIYLCEIHFAERRREERAKVALPKDETTKFIGYEELPAQADVRQTCADADRIDWDCPSDLQRGQGIGTTFFATRGKGNFVISKQLV